MPNNTPNGRPNNIERMLQDIHKGVDQMRNEIRSSVSELDKRITVLESKVSPNTQSTPMDMGSMMNMAMVMRIMERMFR